jgi:hypothetical protein
MNKQFDTLIIGQPSLDINTDHTGHTIRDIGGAVVYSGFAAAALGHSVCVLPKANSAAINTALLFASAKNIEVRALESPRAAAAKPEYTTAPPMSRIVCPV